MPPVEPMKSSLDHLPDDARRLLARIQSALFEEFRAAVAAEPPRMAKAPEILKIILFGRDPRRCNLLVVVNHTALTDRAMYWRTAEARLDALSAERWPASLIVHSLGEVNEALERGRAFFADILKQGVMLFEKSGHPIRKPRPAAAEAALQDAEAAIAHASPIARGFLAHYESDLAAGRLGLAAFALHQATEQLSHILLMATASYAPRSHDLRHLRSLLDAADPRLREVWPAGGGRRRAFDRLNRAYAEARYSRHFEIEREELLWLRERVERLRELVETLCLERIATLRARAISEEGAVDAGEA